MIVEKRCYISRINICYGNPSLDPSKPDLPHLDCITAGRRLPCSLCLLRQGGGTISFSSEAVFPILTPPKSAVVSKSRMKKKDTLSKKEWIAAEKHLQEFGNFIRQMERHSESHKYRPRSSYFPLDVLSSILDHLLVIHFPSHLKDLVEHSWIYYGTHRTALYDSIIDIQTRINVGRTNARELAKSKRHEKEQAATVTEDENETGSLDIEPKGLIDQNSSNQQGLNRKRQAMEDIANRPKRRRAPRAPQPSVAQVQELYGPRYKTRRRGVIEDPSGKENGVQR